MSQLHSDMVATATIYKNNLIRAMAWDARGGRKGVSDFTQALAGVANWLVNFQAGRIVGNEVFSQWLTAVDLANRVWDQWYAAQKQGQWEVIQAWYEGLGLEEQAS